MIWEDWATGPFDLAVSAGNVLAFVDPADRGTVLANLASRLVTPSDDVEGRPGRLVVGFGLDRGWTREDAESRIAAQASREDRLAIATHVIENTGTLEELRARVEEIHAVLVARA